MKFFRKKRVGMLWIFWDLCDIIVSNTQWMREMKENNVNIKNIIRITGAYIAWVIGSGFATGQEVLQFFSSYGFQSFAVVGINLVGFILLGFLMMRAGFENRNVSGFDHFIYFCGKKLGTGYSWLITATLLMLIPVLVSGGGATLNEYYGVPKALGSALLTVAVLTVYLIGFEKMVNIISKIGPVIILFSLTVGVISLVRDIGGWHEIQESNTILSGYRTAPNWWLSGILYLGLNFFSGSTYFTQLGTSASSEREIKFGAFIGGSVLMLCITIMSTSIMLNGNAAAGLDIPVLYLARKISNAFGAVFSIVLVLGIFSSCSAMMWSVCRQLCVRTGKNTVTAIAVAAFGYIVSLFSFGSLIGTVYPIIGYIGSVYLMCVIWKGLRKSE